MTEKKVYCPLTDIENVIPILNDISIFGALTGAQLHFIFKLAQRVSYDADEYIYRRGTSPLYIYIVLSGEVKIIFDKDDEAFELVAFGPGDCFGETSVIGVQTHSTSALAVKKTELIVLSKNALLSIFETDKELFGMLILNIARETCRRLHRADEELFLKGTRAMKIKNSGDG